MGLLSGAASVTRFNLPTRPQEIDFEPAAFRAIAPGSEVRESVGIVPFEPGEDYQVGAGRWAFRVRIDTLKADPAKALSRAYDMVLNGTELGGGSIRIHDQAMQREVFEVLGIGEAEAQEKFGFLLDALKFGAPPHGGLAFGLDRLVMLMTGANTIREVIAFPKTQSAACLMTDAPGEASAEQLKELNIRLRQKAKPEAGGE